MRPSTARIALAAACLAAVGLVGAAQGAPAKAAAKTLSFTDPSGDGKVKGDDITKVTYSTTGTTTKVGKKLVYKPKVLTMSIEGATDIVVDGTVLYEVDGNVAGCGDFYVDIAPGSAAGFLFGTCSEDDTVDFSVASFEVAGKTITFSVPLGAVPGFTAGASITKVLAYTGSVEPVIGIVGPSTIVGRDPFVGTPGEGSVDLGNDTAKTATAYTIG